MSMTQDDVMRLEGRELDEAVARDVLGLTWSPVAGPVPYSRDIDAAWQVVERMLTLGWHLNLMSLHRDGSLWSAEFEAAAETTRHIYGESAPLAICRAALAALRAPGGGGG